MQSSTVAAFGMLIVFEIAPEMKGCAAAIIRMWLSTDNAAPAGAAARVGAVEHRQVLGLQMRRALQGHRAAAIGVGGVDLGPGEAERRQQVEGRIIERARRDPQAFDAELFAQRPFVEREFDVEGRGERRLDGGERAVVEALFAKASRG